MSSLPAFFEQIAKSSSILLDDVVLLAKPALSRIGEVAASAADDTLPLAKTAMKKASAVVVDDTAVSSDQLNEASIAQHREYAVWRKIVTGSLINKVLILAIIIIAGAVMPVLPHILLAFGACYLAIEGAHKTFEYAHHIFSSLRKTCDAGAAAVGHSSQESPAQKELPFGIKAPAIIDRFLGDNENERKILVDLILLDAILSTEILLVANGSLPEGSIALKILILSIVALGTTLGVYSIVLAIIRADNIAAYLADPQSRLHLPRLSRGMMRALPFILKIIGVIGTVAMLGVAGEVIAHLAPSAAGALLSQESADSMHHFFTDLPHMFSALPFGAETVSSLLLGLLGGSFLVALGSLPKLASRNKKQG